MVNLAMIIIIGEGGNDGKL